MIKRNNKKGFTIVELVIVIAVIAILAAVLIPTFAGIIKKANQSADIQAVRQMNTALAAEFAVEKPAGEDMNPIIDALSENGFNSKKALVPVSKEYTFAWSWADYCVVLINDEDTIIFPEGITTSANDCVSLATSIKYVDVVAKDIDTFTQALLSGSEDIKLESDLQYGGEQLTIPTGTTLTLDLNGKNFDASSQGSRPFRMSSNSAIVINAEGSTIESGAYGLVEIPSGVQDVSVTINGGNVTGNMDDGAFIKVRKGAGNINITLNGVSMIDGTDDAPSDSYILSQEGEATGKINLDINGGVFEAKVGFQCLNGTYTVSDANITTDAFAFECGKNTNSTFANCTFEVGGALAGTIPAAAVIVSYEAEATVTDCTITSGNYSFAVLNTGGTITHKNNTINSGTECIYNNNETGSPAGSITEAD